MLNFNPRTVYYIAKKEYLDNTRNKWIILLTIIFILLTLISSYDWQAGNKGCGCRCPSRIAVHHSQAYQPHKSLAATLEQRCYPGWTDTSRSWTKGSSMPGERSTLDAPVDQPVEDIHGASQWSTGTGGQFPPDLEHRIHWGYTHAGCPYKLDSPGDRTKSAQTTLPDHYPGGGLQIGYLATDQDSSFIKDCKVSR